MDRLEALRHFVRANFKLLLSEDFHYTLFKRAKLDFFLDGHKSVGVPKNEDIAAQAMHYLIRNGVINDKDKLSQVLSLPFFAKYIRNKEPFEELIDMQKSPIAIVDPKKLSEATFRDSIRMELKQEVIEEKTQEIEEAIRRKKEEYLSIPSILDLSDFEEPIGQPELKLEEQFLPWWKRLKLSGDPFPTQEGLARITDELYEKVVYKTPIFEKYVVLTREASEELFKNTIFFGEFGSGKTTLFDYLRKPLMNARIFTVYIQLYAESTFQALLGNFRKKLFDGLCQLHELLYDSNPQQWLSSSDFHEGTVSMLAKFAADEDRVGIIVIVDDLHKNIDEFDISMRFINSLQIFKAELLRKIPQINIGFFVAGSGDWERIIKNDPKFSGSYIRHETMPPVTEEAAHEMLNKRLSAFATNPEMIKTINLEFVKRIYRGLQNNKLPITFRSFIRAALEQFEKGNFNILTVDPVFIPEETLAEIKETLEWNEVLKKKIDNLLYGGGIQREENRKKTLDLLIYIYMQKGILEDSKVFQENKFSMQRLARSGLIQKTKLPSGFKWAICQELYEVNKKIIRTYNLSIEDYLAKIYMAPPTVKVRKTEKVNEDLKVLDSLVNFLTNREAKKLTKASRAKHAGIIDEMDKYERKAGSKDIVLECASGLALLTKAIARFLGLEIPQKDDLSLLRGFWREFWFSPGEVSEFINQASGCIELEQSERIWYSCLVYRDAFSVLLNFFSEEADKSRYMMIPIAGLSNEEIGIFHEIRNAWAKNAYFDVAELTTRFIEKKIRSFLFNLFTLLYGDREARLSRLDKTTRDYILQNIQKDQEKGLNVSKNEFEQVNRGNYKNFMIGSYNKDIGRDNWMNSFRQVFAPLTENDVKDFLDLLADVNIATSHVKKGAFGAEQQTLILNYVLRSIDITKRINYTYRTIIEKYLHVLETHGATRFQLYFSLCNLQDKDSLTPIFVKASNASRIADQLVRQGSVSVDLEDTQFIESFFGIGYREFIAMVARLVSQMPIEAKKTGLRVTITNAKGSVITLNATKM
jgi:hypothetical protein